MRGLWPRGSSPLGMAGSYGLSQLKLRSQKNKAETLQRVKTTVSTLQKLTQRNQLTRTTLTGQGEQGSQSWLRPCRGLGSMAGALPRPEVAQAGGLDEKAGLGLAEAWDEEAAEMRQEEGTGAGGSREERGGCTILRQELGTREREEGGEVMLPRGVSSARRT
eukprot:2095348-Rhodomonas_salina.2